jgi:predicted ATPase
MSTPQTQLRADLHSGTAALLDSCFKLIRRYVVLSADQLNVLAAWILHTWAIEAADFTPYLHITAPEKGCGKSRLLETLEIAVRNSHANGECTAAKSPTR